MKPREVFLVLATACITIPASIFRGRARWWREKITCGGYAYSPSAFGIVGVILNREGGHESGGKATRAA